MIDRDQNNEQLMDEAMELREIIAEEKETLNEESEDLGIMIRFGYYQPSFITFWVAI